MCVPGGSHSGDSLLLKVWKSLDQMGNCEVAELVPGGEMRCHCDTEGPFGVAKGTCELAGVGAGRAVCMIVLPNCLIDGVERYLEHVGRGKKNKKQRERRSDS